MRYNVSSNGRLERRYHGVNNELGIFRLSFATPIRETLLSMLMGSDVTQLTYEIENRTISRRLPELFSINRHFRELALLKYSRVRAVGRLMSYNAQATYGDLRSMHDWCMAGQLFIRGEREVRYEKNPQTTLMRFELSEREYLPTLRIPVTIIIVATIKLLLNTELRVDLVRLDLSVHAKVAVKMAILYRLQQQLVIFLADILDFHPGQSTQACPRILMSGNFVIKESEGKRGNGSEFLVKNKNSALNPDEMEEEIDLCINKLLERNDPVTAAYLPHLKVKDHGDYAAYVLDVPHDCSLLGVAVRLSCCLQEAGTALLW
ncbi:hypothetical protein G6011_04448 [Alternaria panax]|uniref:Uncharacterized protein n=1 Tax=Alternaria panax TaxID=48097 RepID=A0AAD4IH90_9PLEO|nr:hypothetical protein G6011_04448 [Alternaria panax]